MDLRELPRCAGRRAGIGREAEAHESRCLSWKVGNPANRPHGGADRMPGATETGERPREIGAEQLGERCSAPARMPHPHQELWCDPVWVWSRKQTHATRFRKRVFLTGISAFMNVGWLGSQGLEGRCGRKATIAFSLKHGSRWETESQEQRPPVSGPPSGSMLGSGRAGPTTIDTSITLETTEPGTTACGRQDFLRVTASASLRAPDRTASSGWLTPS